MTVNLSESKQENQVRMYHKQGKIRWAKLLWIPPNKVYHRKASTVPYV